MPELPVKEIRLSELHLPEIKRDDIVRSLSEIRMPSVELPSVELPRRQGRASRFDWRSVDLGAAVASATALAQASRPLFRRSRVTLAAGTIVVVGIVAAAILATPTVRQRAGATVRRVRDRVDARMTPSDVLELEDDRSEEERSDMPSAGELVTDGALPAPEPGVDGATTDGPIGDVSDADVPVAR